MTNATLRGKPDAGNPHVRFDEGEVASAKPRRGSLLYEKSFKWLCVCVAAVACGLVAHATTYTWTGNGADTDIATAANWEGNVAPGATESGVDLVFPQAGATVTGIGTRTVNAMTLNGGTVTLTFADAGGTLTVNGAVDGEGGLHVVGSDSVNSYVLFKSTGTFTGGYYGDCVRTRTKAENALGTGPAKFRSSNTSTYPLCIESGTTKLENDLTFGLEPSSCGTLKADVNVTLSGTVTFTTDQALRGTPKYNANYRIGGSGTITFAGDVKFSYEGGGSGCFLPAGGHVVLQKRIDTSATIDFNGAGSVEFCAASNKVTYIGFNDWSNGDATYLFSADNPFLDGAVDIGFGKMSGKKLVNLNGHSAVVRSVYARNNLCAGGAREVTSALPATLTIRNDTANHVFYGIYTGALSLEYDCPGRTYNLTNGVSTMTGALRVLNGTMTLKDGAAMDAITSLEVDGTLNVEETAGAFGSRVTSVRIGETGVLNLGGRTLEVETLYVGGAQQAKGVYTAAELPERLVNGTIRVLLSGNEWVWKGGAEGDWTSPANWLVHGEAATVSPSESVQLYIARATEENPFVISGTSVTLANPMILGYGQQVVRFTTNMGGLRLNGHITGPGGFRFTCETGSATEKLYSVRFGDETNDFAGGVRRSDGGTIYLDRGLGTGPVHADKGSENGTGIVNWAPLSTDGSCTVTNDLWIGRESYHSWNGWWTGSGREIIFNGRVDFVSGTSNNDQTRFEGSSFTFNGPVSIGGRLICKTSSTATFNKPIEKYDDGTSRVCSLYADNDSFTGTLAASSNAVEYLYFGRVVQWLWSWTAEDVLPNAQIYLEGTNAPTNARFDLCGNNQHIRDLYYNQPASLQYHGVHFTSESAAALTVQNTADRMFGGTFDGGVSLVYAPTNAFTYMLVGATHSSTGSLTVASGTLVCTNGTQFAHLGAVNVAAGGTLKLTDADTFNDNAVLQLADEATLDFAFSGRQRVQQAFVNGRMLSPGRYGAPDNASVSRHLANLSGTGVLDVRNLGFCIIVK